MKRTRTLRLRGGGGAGPRAVFLAIAAFAIGQAAPVRAQEAAPIGPVRTDRFDATQAATWIHPAVAPGPAGSLDGPTEALPASLVAAGSRVTERAEPRPPWVVAGAALAGGVLGWVVAAGGTLLATHERLNQEDLSPLGYAAAAGAVVSVPAGAVAAHWASRGHGSILASTLLGYAVAGVAIVAWPDGGWALGPALAIPITIAVETL